MSGSIFGDGGLTRAQVGAFTMAPLLSGQKFGTRATSNSTVVVVADTLYATPWIAPETCSLSTVEFRVNTGAAGNAKVGIYAAGAPGVSNLPAEKLGENTADLSTASPANLVGTLSSPVAVVAGRLYWLAACFSAAPSIQGFNTALAQAGGWLWPIGVPAGDNGWVTASVSMSRYTVALAYVAGPVPFLPATFGAGSFGGGAPSSPIFQMVKA